MHTILIALSVVAAAQAEPQRMEWKIDGVTREALVQGPAGPALKGHPLVFVFHGHGGTMQSAHKGFAINNHWPQAVAVYMQGLPTPSPADPQGKRAGWQVEPGAQGDRDLKFFDAVLATVEQKFAINPKQVYVTGFSNGGRFTYILWAMRPSVFAAYAPGAGLSRIGEHKLRPAPVMVVAGEKDPLVKIAKQREQIEALKKLDGCTEAGTEWAKGSVIYRSKAGTPVVTLIHPGGHVLPAAAPGLIVRFFREHVRK